VLIPSLYAINPLTQTLRQVRISRNQNTRWQLFFSTNKKQEFLILSIYIIPDYPDLRVWSSRCRMHAIFTIKQTGNITLRGRCWVVGSSLLFNLTSVYQRINCLIIREPHWKWKGQDKELANPSCNLAILY
jgi:hypothetical protein